MGTKTTKVSADQTKKLESIGIKGIKTVEEGHAALLAFLAKNDIDGVDDEDFDALWAMAEVIFEGSDDELKEAAAELEESEKEAKAKGGKKGKKEAEAEVAEAEAEELTVDQMRIHLIDSGIMKKKEVKELKDKAVIKAFNDAKPSSDGAKEKGKDKPTAAPKAKTTTTKVSKKIDPLNNPEDATKYDAFKKELDKILKGHTLEYKFIANGGLSVRIVGENGSKVFLSYDTPKYNKENEIVASVFMPIKDQAVFEEIFGDDIEIKKAWNGAMYAANTTQKEVIAAFKENEAQLTSIVTSIVKKDEKLGKNREKMYDDLKSDKTDKANKAKDAVKAGKAKEVAASEKKAEKGADKPKKEKVEDVVETPKGDKKKDKKDKKKK